jgi:PAS domain S-box-containing protein
MERDEAQAVAQRPPPDSDTSRGRNAVPIRLLLAEDDRDDAELVRRALVHDGLEVRFARVATLQDVRAALAGEPWDVVICDFSLSGCTGLDVLEEVRRVDREVPFILISGAIDGEQAVAAVRAGAQDYLPKGNLVRLAPAVERELAEAEHRRARYLAEERHRMLVHCSLQGLLMVQNGTVVTANQAAADILGTTPDELLGLSAVELLAHVHPDDRKAFRRHPCSHSSVGERSMRIEVRVIHPDERSRWVEVSVHAMLVDGRPAIRVAMVEVTQRRERGHRHPGHRAALSQDWGELVALLLDETVELLHADEAALASRGRTRGRADFELARQARADAPQSHPHETAGVSGRSLGGGKPPVVDLETSAEGLPRSEVARRARFLAGVPLIADEAVFGVLWISRRRPIEDADRRVLRAVGDIASSALRRGGLHEEMECRLRRLHALRAIDLAITTSHDLEMVFDGILEQVTAQLGVDAATIFRVSGGDALRMAAARGHTGTMDSSKVPFERAGLAGRVATSRKMIECPNLADTPLDSERDRALAAAGFAGFAGVPLLASGELCGVLELLHRDTLEPDEEWRGFLETVAWQVAIALDTAAMVDKLRSSNLSLLQA